MINLEFVSNVEITLSVDKILSENILYKPVRRGKYISLILSNEVREYKDSIKICCKESDFYDYISYLKSSYDNLVVKSKYTFLLPITSFFTKGGDLGRNDVTNMVKSVEDTILGEVIDDRYVIENTVVKSPILGDISYIVANFEFYQFSTDNNISLLKL